jgi:hypothetical protein
VANLDASLATYVGLGEGDATKQRKAPTAAVIALIFALLSLT